jgi:hypothetical protein
METEVYTIVSPPHLISEMYFRFECKNIPRKEDLGILFITLTCFGKIFPGLREWAIQ